MHPSNVDNFEGSPDPRYNHRYNDPCSASVDLTPSSISSFTGNQQFLGKPIINLDQAMFRSDYIW